MAAPRPAGIQHDVWVLLCMCILTDICLVQLEIHVQGHHIPHQQLRPVAPLPTLSTLSTRPSDHSLTFPATFLAFLLGTTLSPLPFYFSSFLRLSSLPPTPLITSLNATAGQDFSMHQARSDSVNRKERKTCFSHS